MTPLQLPSPYLLFLGSETEPAFAKTAFGLRDWARERCVGEFALGTGTVSVGLPALSPAQAKEKGAASLLIGVAPRGGKLDPAWIPTLLDALAAGLDLVSGMHAKLANTPELQRSAATHGRRLFDVRQPPPDLPIATGRKRTGKRVLTVGTDCALGKKYTALALVNGFAARKIAVDFRATGQTGIMIAGGGIPIDAVVSDFVAGAAELLSPDADTAHWDVVEGQGSLFHPSYAGVSLGLLHGTQPDALVVCHEAGRTHVMGLPGYELPSLRETIDVNLLHARRVNPAARCAGISLNTVRLSGDEAESQMAAIERELNLPVADPIRGGARLQRLIESCLGA
jgi:uncharacterized NAD-dependent epimerase/dehydratase family protein